MSKNAENKLKALQMLLDFAKLALVSKHRRKVPQATDEDCENVFRAWLLDKPPPADLNGPMIVRNHEVD